MCLKIHTNLSFATKQHGEEFIVGEEQGRMMCLRCGEMEPTGIEKLSYKG